MKNMLREELTLEITVPEAEGLEVKWKGPSEDGRRITRRRVKEIESHNAVMIRRNADLYCKDYAGTCDVNKLAVPMSLKDLWQIYR